MTVVQLVFLLVGLQASFIITDLDDMSDNGFMEYFFFFFHLLKNVVTSVCVFFPIKVFWVRCPSVCLLFYLFCE